MSAKLQNLRRRLLELEELHATGFVDLAQYEESRALLEHWIVAEVMRDGGDDASAPAATPDGGGPAPDPPGAEGPPGADPHNVAEAGAAAGAAPAPAPVTAPAPAPVAETSASALPMPDDTCAALDDLDLDPTPPPPPARRSWPVWLAAALALPAVAGGLWWWATGVPAGHRAAAVAAPSGHAASAMATLPAEPPGVAQAGDAPASAARVEDLLPAPGAAPQLAAVSADPVADHEAGAAGAPGTIAGTVALAPALAPRVRARDTVFIYARAVDGPPMPLAVIRKQVKDLPVSFVLDDSMAIWPDARVSAHPRVVVTARVSKSGDGKPRAGDIEGQSSIVSAGTAGLHIELGSVVAAPAGDAPTLTR